MVTFRTLTPEEMPTAVQLWVDVFGVEAPFFQTLLDGDPPGGISVGAFEDGKLVSSVHVFIRWFRNREGLPQKVGSIGSVSTLPEARKKGYSGKLLELAIQEMEARDCVWSYLGTGVNDHYARYGWRSVSTPCFKGILSEASDAQPVNKEIVTDGLLDQMGQLYLDFTRDIPMTNGRSRTMWQTAVKYRVTQANDEVFVARADGEMVAYLVSRRSDDRIDLIETACKEGFAEQMCGLIHKRLQAAKAEGIPMVLSTLPELSDGHRAFVDCCDKTWSCEDRAWMVRPIAGRISLPDLVAIHADRRARRSDLDNF